MTFRWLDTLSSCIHWSCLAISCLTACGIFLLGCLDGVASPVSMWTSVRSVSPLSTSLKLKALWYHLSKGKVRRGVFWQRGNPDKLLFDRSLDEQGKRWQILLGMVGWAYSILPGRAGSASDFWVYCTLSIEQHRRNCSKKMLALQHGYIAIT